MPSLGDSAVIIFLGLLLFGPKGLAQIARQLGKLMGEFRRASNEFRMQMEEELRVAEQADRQKEIAAIEAAAPPVPVLTSSVVEETVEEHPHLRAAADTALEPAAEETGEPVAEVVEPAALAQTAPVHLAPLPIATSGELSIMPPASGLPMPRKSSLSALIESVPRMDAPNGHAEVVPDRSEPTGMEQRPMRYTNGHEEHGALSVHDAVDSATAAESVHG